MFSAVRPLTIAASSCSIALSVSTRRLVPAAALTQARFYHEKVLEHYNRPRNVGSLNKNDPSVGTGFVGAPACGDVMKLQIKVDDAGRICDVKIKTFGCGSAIASSSLASEMIKGMTLDDARKVKNTDIAKELSLPPVKLHCSMLAADAIESAIKDYEKKKQELLQQKTQMESANLA